jgi:hypothetical protein
MARTLYCSICGEDIFDRSHSCVHCGAPICPECEPDICPECLDRRSTCARCSARFLSATGGTCAVCGDPLCPACLDERPLCSERCAAEEDRTELADSRHERSLGL